MLMAVCRAAGPALSSTGRSTLRMTGERLPGTPWMNATRQSRGTNPRSGAHDATRVLGQTHSEELNQGEQEPEVGNGSAVEAEHGSTEAEPEDG